LLHIWLESSAVKLAGKFCLNICYNCRDIDCFLRGCFLLVHRVCVHNEGMMKTTTEDAVKVETDCQQCASGTVELLVGFRRGPTIRSKVSNTLLQLIQSVSSSGLSSPNHLHVLVPTPSPNRSLSNCCTCIKQPSHCGRQ